MNKLKRTQSYKEESQDKSNKYCILFTADWCNACKDIDELFNNKKKQYESTVNFKKVNIDDEDADYITIQYKIIKIPTIVIIVEGKSYNYINEEIKDDIFNILVNNTTINDISNTINNNINTN
jgi:thioredoxin-like negative regulator of GroEL